MLVCAVIGTTTFDGFSNDVVWRKLEPHLQSVFRDLASIRRPRSSSPTPPVCCCASRSSAACMTRHQGRPESESSLREDRAERFAHTLVPIGFAYVLAHYFSLLIWQGQAIGYLASDPLGNGANLFGTSTYRIDYTIISFAAIWYVQVAALVAGHVARSDAGARPGPGDLYQADPGGDPLAVLDADGDGGLHELRAVAVFSAVGT